MSDIAKANEDKLKMPEQAELTKQFNDAITVVDDVVLKKYISKLQEMDIVPLKDSDIASNLSENVRFFRITEMVYEKDEYSTYKFASVFNALSTANCAVFVIIDSNGEKTDFYMGIRSLNSDRTTSSLEKTLKNAIVGQFPGTKTQDFLYDEGEKNIKSVVSKMRSSSVSIVSCLANNKDDENRNNKAFVQGLEKLALSMQGEKYTAIILANGTSQEQIEQIRSGYENIYTQLSPFASQQMSYSTNDSISLARAHSFGTSQGTTETQSQTTTAGTSTSSSTSSSVSKTKNSKASKAAAGIAVAAGTLGAALAPFTGGLSLAIGGVISGVAGAAGTLLQSSETTGTSTSESTSQTTSDSTGTSSGQSFSENESNTNTKSLQSGQSRNLTLTVQDKRIQNILERLDMQLKRLHEFESLGMWECAGYFMSDNPYAAEIAASTYKSIMRGENSGVEVSAINSWGKGDESKTQALSKYITNFIHPVFKYSNSQANIEVTPCSLVSGNELAIHMGLPRKSICGFPVIEHADFGKEVVSYSSYNNVDTIALGKVFNMGTEANKRIDLSKKSLSMHTFITGSTGSGKSNTVYEMLRQLKNEGISFMVIEPAKGEYKNVFGKNQDLEVYGTNPQYSKILQINPFRFPKGIHILEHIDRMIEILNVCWPMYAAMPAVLKDAILQAYEVCGWDLVKSTNRYSDDLFPTFMDLQLELKNVIECSSYSDEVKGNYVGSLITRVKSLTNGLNGQIFAAKEIDNHKLFDTNVIVDISRIGSLETKSLIMGILIMRLNEHRMSNAMLMNSPLKHITVLEEAHNILKRTSTEQNPESSNMAGKSVEMISNAIAEMRTYGEGFIIADQSPNAVDISAIRNTNTKIIMRLPDESDRRLAGKAAALNDEQVDEIAKLPCGVAVVYQNDWIEPVLCKIKKFEGSEEAYQYTPSKQIYINENKFTSNLLKLLLKGRMIEKIEPDIDLLKEQLKLVTLSTKDKIGILNLVNEYEETGKLKIWDDEKFDKLSEIITNLITNQYELENAIISSSNFERLTNRMIEQITRKTDDLSADMALNICQCFMKNYSKDDDEKLQIYAEWRKQMIKGVLV